MDWKIPLFKMFWDENDVDAVSQIIQKGTYWAMGSEIEHLERLIAQFVGRKYALCFNSGTSALHVLLLSHNIKGKEVIVPSFTFIATINAVVLAGGIPVFAESENETFGLDAEDVKKKITDNTIAILPIHYGGFPSRDIFKLQELAKEKGLLLIEDAAESLGAKINSTMIGSIGDSAIFSFCQNKVITTGEGGVLLTDDELIYEKAKLLRSHGRVEEQEDYFSSINDQDYITCGYNYRMPTICAALGISQFNKINKVILMRREKAKYLSEQLSTINGLKTPTELPNHFSVYQMYTLELPNKEKRDGLQRHLAEKGIMSKIYFNPVHLKTLYQQQFGSKKGNLPYTEELSNKVLNIPLFPTITYQELDFIALTIKGYLENN